MTANELLERLGGARKSGRGWEAHCPAHDDKKRSLTVAVGDSGALLLKCHAGAGCSVEQIVAALGLKMADLFPRDGRQAGARDGRPQVVATYDYTDEKGALLFQVVRYKPKDFRRRRPDGNGGWSWKLAGVPRALYRLPELLAADPATVVYVVEGEKDVEALRALGLVATTNPGGAGKWRPDYNEHLRDRDVVLLPDRDDAGRDHAEAVAVLSPASPGRRESSTCPASRRRATCPTGWPPAGRAPRSRPSSPRVGRRRPATRPTGSSSST